MENHHKMRAWNPITEKFYYLNDDEFYGGDWMNDVDSLDSMSADKLKEHNSILKLCTGLKDKNGKLIYEGDIIQSSGFILKCAWIETEFCYLFLSNCKSESNYYLDEINSEYIEIIGNIHENPELLEKK